MSFVENKRNCLSVRAAYAGKWIGKYAPTAGLALLCVLTAASVYLGIFVAAERLHAAWAFNTGEETFCVMVCVLMYFGCFVDRKNADKSVRMFMVLLLCAGSEQFLDICCRLMYGVAELRVLNSVVFTLYASISALESYQVWRYLRAYLDWEGTLARWCGRAMDTVVAFEQLLFLVNLFVPICFHVDEEGIPSAGDWFALTLLYLLASFVCGMLCLLRAKASLRNKLIIAVFFLLPLVQGFFPESPNGASLPGVSVLGTMLMYVVLVAERSKKLALTSAELNTATRIQANMLPNTFPAFPKRKEFELYATMDPAKEVGGDFYDFFLVDDDHLALVMADVSGKGVPAALFMMTARTFIKDAALEGLDPSSIMFRVNERLDENNKDGLFVTVWLGILEISTGELTYSDAGHEKLLLYQQGVWRFLPKGGCTALAVLEPDEFDELPESYRYRNETIRLQSGDVVFQYTDGVTEATDAQEELFGDERLLNAINDAGGDTPEDLLPHVRRKIDEFVKDAPQFDDITMLGLRYLGKGE